MLIEERRASASELYVEDKNGSMLVNPYTSISTGLLLLRIVLGIIFIAHGGQKVFGWFGGPGLSGTVGFMGSMGIPSFLTYLASFTEFFGGISILLGLLTRVSALGLTITMLVAIAMVHLKQGFFAPNGFEYPLALGVIALVLLIVGPGRYSLDYNLFNKKSV